MSAVEVAGELGHVTCPPHRLPTTEVWTMSTHTTADPHYPQRMLDAHTNVFRGVQGCKVRCDMHGRM